MKGGYLYGVRGKQLFLTFISISCTTILVCKWEKNSWAPSLVSSPDSSAVDSTHTSFSEAYDATPKKDQDLEALEHPRNEECNYAKGKWIRDKNRPLYSGFECKGWLSEMWACRLTERTDFSYEGFKWQPDGCDMPDFKPSTFLNRMRNKTIALVGDSLGRQQFQSLMCMLTASGDNDLFEVLDIGMEYGFVKANGATRPEGWAYLFPITNTTILFYWTTTLCELEPLNVSTAMHLDRPPRFLTMYLHKFDVLLLNTGHHWNRGKLNEHHLVMYIGGLPVVDKKLVMMGNAKNYTIYSIVRWVDTQLPRYPKLKAFLRTLSPRHFVNGDWNTRGKCDNTNSLAKGNQVANLSRKSGDEVAEGAVRGTKMKLLDITLLSKLRDEAHISKYMLKASPGSNDCLHWCLPGIPDTWNEVLAAQI